MKFNIVNEIKLSYSRKGNCERGVESSLDAVQIFREHFDADEMDYRESFFALYLNQANKVLGIKKISECGISSTLVDVRIVMQAALLCATSLVVIDLVNSVNSSETFTPSEPKISDSACFQNFSESTRTPTVFIGVLFPYFVVWCYGI